MLSAAAIFILGYSISQFFKNAGEPHYNHSIIIAAAGWLGIAMMGGVPYFVIAWITPDPVMNQWIPEGSTYTFSSLVYFKNPLHCLFESMSAFTTTGLTMAVHEPSVGKGILFYRHFSQWAGGAGFIVMALAIFRQTSGRSAYLLYGSDSTKERLRPTIISTARAIWQVYLIVTLFSALYLFVGTLLILPDYPIGENVFDSINHAMAGQSTGGFSTLDDSIAGYHSAAMEILYLFPMILGSFSIPFFFKVIYQRKFSEFWRDIQTRALIIAFLLGGLIQSALLFYADSVPNALRVGMFQFVSALSTTGWQTSDVTLWDWRPILFIIFAGMMIGGASGGTVGGIKMIRALIIKKGLRWMVTKSFFSENTIKVIKFNGKTLLPEQMNEEFVKASAMAIMFIITILISTVIATFYERAGYDFSNALFEAASAQGTVGLSSGITFPDMPPLLEIVYIFQMWAGRLEIIPVLALIRAIFLGTNPRII